MPRPDDAIWTERLIGRWPCLRTLIVGIGAAWSLCGTAALAVSAEQNRAPNLVLILADDLGYGDLSSYGAPDARTPNIDRLGKQGVRFTQHYASAPECTPTRTALLTGRYPQRVGGMECAIGTGNVGRYDDAARLAGQHELGLPPDMAVLPRVLAAAGYRCGIFGKWHLGYDAKFNPLEFGFDRFFGCLGGNVDYFTHKELSPLPVLYAGRRAVERDGYMTHLITDAAVEFLDESSDKPFFLYLPYTSPHFPFQAPGDGDKQFTEENFTQGTRATYVKMLEDLDAQVGRVVAELQRRKQLEDTVVIFASDNGAMAPGRNLPFRDYKSKLFEGGIRAPLLVQAPGRIKPGTECRLPCLTMDLTPSLIALAEAKPAGDWTPDGIDLIGHVIRGEQDFMRSLFWRARRGERTERAVRYGDLKYLHRRLDDGTVEEYLFDLAADPDEQNNLLPKRSEDAGLLKDQLSKWEQRVKPVR